MRGALTVTLAVALLLGCVSPRDGQFTCPNPGDRCPEGQTCVAGTCQVGDADAGIDGGGELPDADAGDVDGGVDAGPDAGPPCVGTDEDGDGVCLESVPPDCDDTRASVFPGREPDECIGFQRDEEGRDNDCDGAIDEGCHFSIGVSHLPLALHGRPAPAEGAPLSVRSPAMGVSGERLYYVRAQIGGAELTVASRVASGDTLGAFATPVNLAGVAQTVGSITITGDELTLYYDTATPAVISRVHRNSTAEGFGLPTAVTPAASTIAQPSVTRDGSELFATDTSANSLVHVQFEGENSIVEPIGAAGSGAANPQISADGLTLYFTVGIDHRELRRAELGAPFDGVPVAVPEALRNLLGPSGVQPLIHPETREVWFTRRSLSFAEAPLLVGAMFRAHSCREESCDEPFDACDGLPSGVPTADGLHCFYMGGGGETPPGSFASCESGDSVASVHGPEETSALVQLATDAGVPVWIGYQSLTVGSGFDWFTSEPNLGDNFDAPPPADRPRYTIIDPSGAAPGLWNTEPASSGFATACEREIWPTWPVLAD